LQGQPIETALEFWPTFAENPLRTVISLLFSLNAGKRTGRQVRTRLRPPPPSETSLRR